MAAAALIAGIVVLSVVPFTWSDPISGSLIGAMMAMSLVVVTGLSGQVSLAQMSVAGFGAFVAGKLAIHSGVPFPLPVLAAAVGGAVLGALLGLPAQRAKGLNLAIITLGFAVLMDDMFFTSGVAGGDAGLTYRSASIFGYSLDGIEYARRYSFAVLLFTVLVGFGVSWLRRSTLGLSFLAVRGNEAGARASGIGLARTKIAAFALSGAIAGVAGALTGYRTDQASWAAFAYTTSVVLVAYAYMGGITTIAGSLIAGLLVSGGLLSYALNFGSNADQYIAIAAGLGTIYTVVDAPAGAAEMLRSRIGKQLARLRKPPPMPPPRSSGDAALIQIPQVAGLSEGDR
jgi:ABC-type branched-subunit amino acid transport system permease subunit